MNREMRSNSAIQGMGERRIIPQQATNLDDSSCEACPQDPFVELHSIHATQSTHVLDHCPTKSTPQPSIHEKQKSQEDKSETPTHR